METASIELQAIQSARPPLGVRLYFWFVLSALSVYFAESGASPTGLFRVWGLVVLVPLYGLHVLLLAALAYRDGPPRIVTLYAAGAILGLYEAYITKMLWHHTWGPIQWPVAGISLLAFLQLVVFWHPMMAFMAPVWVGAASTRNGASVLPTRARAWLRSRSLTVRAALGLGIAAGLCTGNGGRPLYGLLNGLTMAALLLGWRRLNRRWNASMTDLLPRRGEIVALGAVLALYYVVLGRALRPAALPGLWPQVTIWLLYAHYFWLTLRTSRTPAPSRESGTPPLAPEAMAYFALAMTAGACIVCAIPHGLLIGLVVWSPIGWYAGARLSAATLREALRHAAANPPQDT